MSLRISDLIRDLPKLNRELQRFDQINDRVTKLSDSLDHARHEFEKLKGTQEEFIGINNILFTWTGSTLKVSWPAGFVRDKAAKSFHVDAGDFTAAASTYYWAAWNINQRKMQFSTSLAAVTTPNNQIICRLYTGTAGQSGPAGGGGSEPGGDGTSSKEYKLF